MKEILFITGNKRKIWQAEASLKSFNVSVKTQDLDIVEIQSHDPLEISLAKAHAAFEATKKPLVICDHSWAFPALKGFPGGYMKDMNHWFESEDFILLLSDKTDKTAVLTETIVYVDGNQTQSFSSEFKGTVVDEPRGVGLVPCERVVVFDGQTETIAEMIDAGNHARDMKYSAWVKFAEWYAAQGNA